MGVDFAADAQPLRARSNGIVERRDNTLLNHTSVAIAVLPQTGLTTISWRVKQPTQ
jgi:hypothetical protein